MVEITAQLTVDPVLAATENVVVQKPLGLNFYAFQCPNTASLLSFQVLRPMGLDHRSWELHLRQNLHLGSTAGSDRGYLTCVRHLPSAPFFWQSPCRTPKTPFRGKWGGKLSQIFESHYVRQQAFWAA